MTCTILQSKIPVKSNKHTENGSWHQPISGIIVYVKMSLPLQDQGEAYHEFSAELMARQSIWES